MHRQHRLIREAIAQRAAEVNRLAAQYERDARGDYPRPAHGGANRTENLVAVMRLPADAGTLRGGMTTDWRCPPIPLGGQEQ